MKNKNVLISGGSGMIGKKLSALLKGEGYEVAILSRSGNNDGNSFRWDIKNNSMDDQALEFADHIIHLAGAGIADKKWSSKRKKEIMDSRVESSKLLFHKLQSHEHRVRTFISASAVGIYGNERKDELLNEESLAGNDFLAQVTKEWESAVIPIADLGIRTTLIRIGVVLSPDGGALSKLVLPIKWGAGAPLGSGQQYMSWVHHADLANIFLFVLKNETLDGIFNAVAPNPVTNREITRAIAKVLNRLLFLPNVPAIVLKLMLGEMATIVLGGNRVSSSKIENVGFSFKYPEISAALDDML